MKFFHYSILVFFLLVTLSACGKKVEQPAEEKKPVPEPIKQEALFPYFKVDVQLTPAALKKIKATKSQISVSFEFGTELGPDSLNMVSASVNLTKPDTIVTDTLNISPENVDKLGTDYEINVNGFSVGKPSEFNFLECSSLQGKIADFLGGNHIMKCDLLKVK